MVTVADILGPGGTIARHLPDYEVRNEQLVMAEEVARALIERQPLLIEAGTGVGKSFGYLVPALLAATTINEQQDDDQLDPEKPPPERFRVVVSTHTISLQEQLVQKDIPFLRSIWHKPFSAVLAKGRGNYISRRRLDVAITRAGGLFVDPRHFAQLEQVAHWASSSADGSVSELPFRPESAVWDQVRSDHNNCMGKKCPEYKGCFFYNARREAWKADLLIVNHSLLFTDLALRRQGASILPRYHAVIFDEAHTVEDAAASNLGLEVSSGAVDYLLTRLFNERTNKGLAALYNLRDLCEQTRRTRNEAAEFFDALQQWYARFGGKNGRVRDKNIIENTLSEPLFSLSRMIGDIVEKIAVETERMEIKAAASRCVELGQGIAAWLDQVREQDVYWIEPRAQGRLTMASSPIEIGPLLQQELWSKIPASVLTSATLGAGGERGYAFMQQRLGLDSARAQTLGSPFDYQRQATLHLLSNLPDPGQKSDEYEEWVIRLIPEYLDITQGHALVLFTSFRALQYAAEKLTATLTARRYPLFAQGDGMPRTKMLEEFRHTPHAVLFGVDSFWQGVDVRGDALQMVIITRLPFTVPDRPLTQARLETITARGGNAFVEYSVPEAIIKLKQGFGRLIRTHSDHGHVVILDPRVLTKAYGQQFLAALPTCPRQVRRV